MLKFTIQGEGVEIWFTPSFNLKTTSNELAAELKSFELDVFDIKQTAMRKVKAQQGEWEAYLLFSELALRYPKLNITFEITPELPAIPEETKKEKLLF